MAVLRTGFQEKPALVNTVDMTMLGVSSVYLTKTKRHTEMKLTPSID
jgi:hypothetical protein